MQTTSTMGLRCLALAASLSATLFGPHANAMPTNAARAAQASWRTSIKQLSPPSAGCFHASFPSLIWHKIACGPSPSYLSATPPQASSANEQASRALGFASAPNQVGNGSDYSAQTSNITFAAVGSFPAVNGVTSESGNYGPNDYSLQLNTDLNANATACANFGYAQCQVWSQFIYATSIGGNGPQVFIQNWVFPSAQDYDSAGCPAGWTDASGGGGAQCYFNSQATNVPAVAATQLAEVTLSGSASSNGNDTATFTVGTDAYSASQADSTVNLSGWWSVSEFNIFGNAAGNVAQFNSGSSITVHLAVDDGTTNAPTCLSAGTTGETNNLNLGTCTASAGSTDGATKPSIEFTESN